MGNITHILYNYFELEGIPAYLSHFVAVDFKYEWWIDKNDTKRFRIEKDYATRSTPIRTGIVALTTSVGPHAKIVHTEFWDDKPDSIEKDHATDNISYDNWVETFTSIGRKLTGEIEQKDSIYTYLGVQPDETWGDVHVFQMKDAVQASDIYLGLPLVITYKIAVDNFRWIEMEHKIIENNEEILFRLLRLATWEELEADSLPSDLFNHSY